MQHITDHPEVNLPTSYSYRPSGGRIASDRYRKSIQLCESFAGLEPGFSRFDLLLLLKRVGREAGFTPKMIHLVEYYLTVFTRDIDWEAGRPIVYQSLSKTALDLGVSERHIQKLEKQLFELGAIGYLDSGNCKRFGQRDPRTGVILWAFGVDLSPLAHLREELERRLEEKELYNLAWHETKREITWQRRQIRALLLEWREEGARLHKLDQFELAYQDIAYQLRTNIRLEALRTLLQSHKELREAISVSLGVGSHESNQPSEQPAVTKITPNGTSTSTELDAHNKYTNQSLKLSSSSRNGSGFQKSVAAGPVPQSPTPSSGAEHVSLKQVKAVASERFRNHLPIDVQSMKWRDVVAAADQLRGNLQISQTSWGEACSVLGRNGAALCLLVTDRATLRDDQPVRQPAAYFRGMVNRARGGELRLHNSVFGLLGKRDQ